MLPERKSMVDNPADGVQHFRCVGVGVGPANLSLASILYGYPEITNLFLDKVERFSWHDGQQIPGATLQVSMLKDLVSLTDPTNPFSFLAYLHEHGRIYHFINAQFSAIPRQEFRNYLEWASRRNANVVFGEEVLSVDLVGNDFLVQTSKRRVTAENLVIGVGNRPWLPEPARPYLGSTQFHVSEFVDKARELAGKRVCVVGGGQSGAEAFLDLLHRPARDLPRRVTWVSRRSNYFPIDDSPFTNDYYMPCYSEYFYGLSQDVRQQFNVRHVLTSDGISEDTLREIYQRIYIQRFIHGYQDLMALYPNRQVTDIAVSTDGGWTMTVVNNDDPAAVEQIEADVIIWATGFRSTAMTFMEPIIDRMEREGDELRVDPDFAVRWDGPTDRNVFVQNAARGQRGLADPNLSLVAWRSQRICDRLRHVRSDGQLAGFIEWGSKPTNAQAGV
jgi:lysine N6-hydroxylase